MCKRTPHSPSMFRNGKEDFNWRWCPVASIILWRAHQRNLNAWINANGFDCPKLFIWSESSSGMTPFEMVFYGYFQRRHRPRNASFWYNLIFFVSLSRVKIFRMQKKCLINFPLLPLLMNINDFYPDSFFRFIGPVIRRHGHNNVVYLYLFFALKLRSDMKRPLN